MIYLVSILDKSYAHREMEYTRYFLNKICKGERVKHITSPYERPDITPTDWLVVADYKCHPLYDTLSEYEKHAWTMFLENVNTEQLVVWMGDARFECKWECPYMAIGSYMSVWEDFSADRYEGFLSQFPRTIVPITWKSMLPELPYDYSLSETQCCWDPFVLRDKEIDLTYIMHGTVKHRLSQLQWLDNLYGTTMVGDWEDRTEPEVQKFVKRNPNVLYQKYKMFGSDWLSLVSKARYTIIADDDNKEFPAMLSARFWEAVRAECIPLIYEPKDPQRKIFEGFDYIQSVAYFNNHDDIQRTLVLRPHYRECLIELKRFEQKYVGGAL